MANNEASSSSSSSSSAYNLRNLSTPVVSGVALRLLVVAIENSLLLETRMQSEQNGYNLRQLSLPDDGTPTPFKHVLPDVEAHKTPLDLQSLFPEERQTSSPGFRFATVADFHKAFQQQTTTPEAIAQRIWESITLSTKATPPLNAFIATDKEDIMEQARASTKRYQEGKPLSMLDGVPVAVKDELDQLGYPTTLGTVIYGKTKAEKDSEVVKKLREAGALLIGKTNMHEIGIGVTGANVHYGYPRNPYDPHRHTGGSSSGSAAATAAGFCPVSVGADGGGSIRIPAGFCGVVGLKATYGRITENGVFPICSSVGHVGPIAVTAQDCALAYGLLAGPDPAIPLSYCQPRPTLSGFHKIDDFSDLRIGVYTRYFEDADPAVVGVCKAMLDKYVAKGASIVEIEIPHLDEMRVAHMISIVSEMRTCVQTVYPTSYTQLAPTSRLILGCSPAVTSMDYLLAQRMRTQAMKTLEGIFEKVDVIATPSAGVLAPLINVNALQTDEINGQMIGYIMRFMFLANLTGIPAISFPAGYVKYGGYNVPVAFQFMGRWWEEHVLLRLANAADHMVPREKPAVYFPLLE